MSQITFNNSINYTGALTIANTTASTSNSSGSLIVSGGMGVAADLYANSLFVVNKRFQLSTDWASWGDSWTKPAPYTGDIETFTSRLSTSLGTSGTYKIVGVSGLNISGFWESGSPAKWYYKTNSPVYNTSTHIHASTNDIFDPISDQAAIYMADNLYSIYLYIHSMLFTCCLPLESITLAKNYFSADGSKFVSSDFTYFGTVRTTNANVVNGDILGTSSTLSGRYYYIQCFAETNSSTAAVFEILVDGVSEAYVKIPAYNNADYASQTLATDVQVYGIFIDKETVAARTITLKITTKPTTANIGVIYLATWSDTQGNDAPNNTSGFKFRNVLIDTPPLFDFAAGTGALPALTISSGYPKLLQMQMRYYNIHHAIETCVRNMRALGLPISLNRWNNTSNCWISDYYHPNNSMAVVNAKQIQNLHIPTSILAAGNSNKSFSELRISNEII